MKNNKIRALKWWKPALCGVSMLLYATALAATETYIFRTQNGDYVKLTAAPCTVVKDWLKLSAAEVQFGGKIYAACWTLLGEVVIIFDAAGDVFPIQRARFKREETI